MRALPRPVFFRELLLTRQNSSVDQRFDAFFFRSTFQSAQKIAKL
jgi:hypothetical protein